MSLFTDAELPFALPDSVGYAYRWDDARQVFVIDVPDGQLLYAEQFFDADFCARAMAFFLENDEGLAWQTTDWRAFEQDALGKVGFKNVAWRHDKITMFGKQVYQPRYAAWHGDKSYTYSGLTMQPSAWNKGLSYFKDKVEAASGATFNSVFLNWYRDGDDYAGWHADNEKMLGNNPVIGSLSFGASRRFLLRRTGNHQEKIEIPLKNGSFLVMSGALQHFWQHSVAKEKKVKHARFNLTFRTVI